jgi:hypothetical protein
MQAGIASAKDAAPRTVWAKANVGLEQFRFDALECGMKGLARNVDDTEEVKTLARAAKQLEAIDSSSQASWSQDAARGDPSQMSSAATNRAIQEQAVIQTARPDEQYARIKELMFQIVRSCMIERGYAKIVLTEDQRKEYSRIKGGVDVQRAYIHKLASDPHVLEAQREPAEQ